MNELIIPNHVGIIMDGNGRWAKEHGQIRSFGHKKGAETLETLVKYCNKIGLKYLTVYAFSTENWKRSKDEVAWLMKIFKTNVDRYLERKNTENIRIRIRLWIMKKLFCPIIVFLISAR